MKKLILPFIGLILLSFVPNIEIHKAAIERFEFEQYLRNHHYKTRAHLSPKELKKMPKADRPDLAWEQDFLATMDPQLKRPARERLQPIFQQVQQYKQQVILGPGAVSSPWVERGPDNVGGRTRAVMYDPNDATQKKVWAGGVSGGLWYNSDITDASSTWISVDDFWSNLSISCMAYDPNDSNTFYVGTGEGWFARASRGAGIWKTTNGGSSWNQISSTTGFYYVNDLVVRNESGTSVVYAAVDGSHYMGAWHGSSNSGVQRSTNGGTSWTQVLPTIPGESINYVAADIEIGQNNDLWVGTKASPYGGTDRGGGRVLKSSNGTTWTTELTHPVTNGRGRVAIACAPSDSNYAYALIENNSRVDAIKQTTNGGSTWTTKTEPDDADLGIPSTDFSRGQAWYDLTIAVEPGNRSNVIVGGIDLFRSTNGGSAWTQISKWSNNQNLNTLSCSFVHADQHAIVFKPGSSNQVLFGCDGGVFYTDSLSYAGNNDVIHPRNKGYNVTQYYACALHPEAGRNYFLAGSQDNGTQQYNAAGMNSTYRATGGDGAYCHIDQTDTNKQITSYVYNCYWTSANAGSSFQYSYWNRSKGKFINPTDYDNNQDLLFSCKDFSSIYRFKNMNGSSYTVDSITIAGLGSEASHLRVSQHTTNSTTLFVGTESGKLFKLTNADGASPSSSAITGSSFPTANLSCVEVGQSEDKLLVTFSNYGVTSVWYSHDGGSNWVSKEGNLPDMPIRWALFNPNDSNEVILATEVGVWSTTNFSSSSPSWIPSNSGLANVRVDMLQIRDSDDEVIAATHGRGLFSSDGFQNLLPAVQFSADETTPCVSDTVTLSDMSSNTPTSWSWTISPSSYSFVSGFNAQSQNPKVIFNGQTNYNISLKASNANGSDSLYKGNYISIAVTPQITIQNMTGATCENEKVNYTAQVQDGGVTPTITWYVNGISTGVNGASYSSSNLKDKDIVEAQVATASGCYALHPVTSAPDTVVIYNNPVVSFGQMNDVCDNLSTFALTQGSPAGGIYKGAGVSMNNFDPSAAGLGTHQITYVYGNSHGCIDSATSNIRVLAAPAKPSIQANGTLLSIASTPHHIQWYYNGSPLSGANSSSITASQNGWYHVVLEHPITKCTESSDSLHIDDISLDELKQRIGLKVYPNPANTEVHISSVQELKGLQQLSLVNVQGKVVQQMPLRDGVLDLTIDLRHFDAGIYILKIATDNHTITQRITINH